MYFITSRKLFKEVYDKWYESYAARILKPRTRKNYDYLAQKHVLPVLGDTRLRDFNEELILNFFEEKQSYSVQYKKLIRTLMSDVMDYAVGKLHYIPQNPFSTMKINFGFEKAKKEEDRYLSKEVIDLFFQEYPEDTAVGLAARIGYWTGLRVGEVCALTWDNVDFDNRMLYVEHALSRDPYGKFQWAYGEPKTESSVAGVDFGHNLEQILLQKKQEQELQRENGIYYKYTVGNKGWVELAGNELETLPFICTDKFGRFLTPSNLTNCCYRFSKKYNTHVTFHMFRHTHATYLNEQGVDIKEIQRRLRHKKASTTLDVYTHATQEMRNKTLAIVDAM